MKHSRVSSSLDVNRLGQALRRPGLDTRSWVSRAVVQKFVLDPDEGPFADVVLLPSGDEVTVHVGSFYAGPGFGFSAPLDVDDQVIVEFPDGDPDLGGVVVARTWSKSDPPSSTTKDNPSDVCLHVKDGVNVRIAVTGGGKVLMGAAGEATKSVNREGDDVDLGTWQVTAVATGIQTIQITPPGGGAPITLALATPGPFPLTGKTKHGSDVVEASD